MKEGQDTIYYMAADSKSAAESAPFVEQLVKRDYEVRGQAAPGEWGVRKLAPGCVYQLCG